MAAFEEVRLTWGGKPYVIPPDGVMRAIAIAEDIITLDELARAVQKQAIPRVRIAEAFAAVLRYAGANVTADDVHAGMFAKGGDQGVAALAALNVLMSLMLPPSSFKAEAPPPGKPKAGRRGS